MNRATDLSRVAARRNISCYHGYRLYTPAVVGITATTSNSTIIAHNISLTVLVLSIRGWMLVMLVMPWLFSDCEILDLCSSLFTLFFKRGWYELVLKLKTIIKQSCVTHTARCRTEVIREATEVSVYVFSYVLRGPVLQQILHKVSGGEATLKSECII